MSSVGPGDKPQAVWLDNASEHEDDAVADHPWEAVDPGQVFDHKSTTVWLEQHGQHRSATTIRRHGIRLEANRRVEAIRGRSPAPMMLEAEPRVARIVATPREHRGRSRTTAPKRGSPHDPDPEPPPIAHQRGFLAASVRMIQHCERRRAKWAAA